MCQNVYNYYENQFLSVFCIICLAFNDLWGHMLFDICTSRTNIYNHWLVKLDNKQSVSLKLLSIYKTYAVRTQPFEALWKSLSKIVIQKTYISAIQNLTNKITN